MCDIYIYTKYVFASVSMLIIWIELTQLTHQKVINEIILFVNICLYFHISYEAMPPGSFIKSFNDQKFGIA